MLFVHEVHRVVGRKEDEFEAAFREGLMPTLAKDDDARLLWYMNHAHGSGVSYQVVTITGVRDGAAWERLARRLQQGDLQDWAREVDTYRHDVTAKTMLPVYWSAIQEVDFADVPTDGTEHELSLFMEDTGWPYSSLDDYIKCWDELYYQPILALRREHARTVTIDVQACFQNAHGAGTAARGDALAEDREPGDRAAPAHRRICRPRCANRAPICTTRSSSATSGRASCCAPPSGRRSISSIAPRQFTRPLPKRKAWRMAVATNSRACGSGSGVSSCTAEAPVHAVLQVEPRLDAQLGLIDEHWENEPALPMSRYVDGFGNLCRRVTLPAGESVLRYFAVVELSGNPDPVAIFAGEVPAFDLPDDTLTFTLPSRLCPSDELASTAWELFGDVTPGWPRVQAVCNWVHNQISFGYGTSTSVSTAQDVLEAEGRVPRFRPSRGHVLPGAQHPDPLHVRVSRRTSASRPENPMDFCAWMEVFLDGSWWTFDPRNNERRVGRVLIGRGRDAVDVAMVTAYGPAELVSMEVWADEVVP